MGKDIIRRDDFLPKGFTATATGLQVGHEVTEEDIMRGCKVISRLANVANESLPYWIGDLLVAAEQRFPNRYEQALEFTDYTVETLRNYVWICKNVPSENRGIMSVPHTAAVAKCTPDQQRELLQRGKKEGLSISEFRRLVKGDPDYKSRLLPGDASSKKDRLIAMFDRVFDENWHEWSTMNSRDAFRKAWELCIDLSYKGK